MVIHDCTLEILMVSVILITRSSMSTLYMYVHIKIYHALTLVLHTHHNHTHMHKLLAVYIYMCVYKFITHWHQRGKLITMTRANICAYMQIPHTDISLHTHHTHTHKSMRNWKMDRSEVTSGVRCIPYSTLNHTATPCNAPQHTVTYCNTLQHAATHCNTLQHNATLHPYQAAGGESGKGWKWGFGQK